MEEELKQLVEIGKHPNIVGLIGYGIRDGNSLFALPFTRARCELFVGNLELSSRTNLLLSHLLGFGQTGWLTGFKNALVLGCLGSHATFVNFKTLIFGRHFYVTLLAV